MKYIFFLMLWSVQFTQAQTTPPHIKDAKRGLTWNSGYNSFATWIVNGRNIVGRTEDHLPLFTMQRFDAYVDFFTANAVISDTAGYLLFYTNGVMIGDKNKNIMMSCDTLNPGYWNNNADLGYFAHKAVLILPQPNHDSMYYVFHNRMYDSNAGIDSLEGAYYTTVNMNRNNGLGEVVSLRNPITQNSRIARSVNATRHANGRDWWVIIRRCHSDEYLPILLDPTGVHPQGWQAGMLPQWSPFSYNNFTSQDAFSNDGRLFCSNNMSAIGNCITLYDFDRCTGRFSNPRLYNWNDSTYSSAGCAFSESSQYLYINSSKYMFQCDVTRTNPFGQIDTVGIYDEVPGPHFFENVTFGLSQLAANGKIYNTPFGGSVIYYHVINNPDLTASNTDFVQRGIELLTVNASSIPNMPNFCLGPVDGSSCDTLGIDNVPTYTPKPAEILAIKVFPNPANDYFTIETENIKGNAYLYNALGQLVKQSVINGNRTQFFTNNIPNGIYFLCFMGANNAAYAAKKIIVQHE